MHKSYFTFKDHYSLASETYKNFIFNPLGNDYSNRLEPPPEGIGLCHVQSGKPLFLIHFTQE